MNGDKFKVSLKNHTKQVRKNRVNESEILTHIRENSSFSFNLKHGKLILPVGFLEYTGKYIDILFPECWTDRL